MRVSQDDKTQYCEATGDLLWKEILAYRLACPSEFLSLSGSLYTCFQFIRLSP